MTSRDELRDLRLIGEINLAAQHEARTREIVAKFEAKLADVSIMLEKRLRAAARMQYLELKLIAVDSDSLIDLSRVCCIDAQRRGSHGGPWATVDPYQDKTAVKNSALLAFWNRLESMSLQPIFIEGGYGRPILGVQLPDGSAYPRKDLARDAAGRTMNRMDEYLNEDGTFSFTSVSAILSRGP